MKHLQIRPEKGFQVIAGTARSEAATMVLAPGSSTGGPENTHDGDQWLYVLTGAGRATVAGRQLEVEAGSLLLIEAGEAHQIDNPGSSPLKTLNFYAPPEF